MKTPDGDMKTPDGDMKTHKTQWVFQKPRRTHKTQWVFQKPRRTPGGDMKIYGSLHQALWKPLQSLHQAYVV